MTRTLSVIALTLSAAAMTVAIWSALRADAAAEEALRKREFALVEQLKPKVVQICEDFDMDATGAKNARTLDDLFAPVFKLMQSVSGE